MDSMTPTGPGKGSGGRTFSVVWRWGVQSGGRIRTYLAAHRGMAFGIGAGVVVAGAGAWALTHGASGFWKGAHVGILPPHRHQAASAKPAPGRGIKPARGAAGPSDATAKPLLMPVAGTVNPGFGWVYTTHLGEWYYNPGVTIDAPAGSTVHAAWAGRVTGVGMAPMTGLTVTIDDGNQFRTVYSHLGTALVKPGAQVKQGDPIGTVGGASLYSRQPGPHIDFQVYHQGQAVNPQEYERSSS
jgi:murein DD-endopeptidase MepM/ murein hydrolase activator NlpD